jgi:nitrous oxidase accessory protein NosD
MIVRTGCVLSGLVLSACVLAISPAQAAVRLVSTEGDDTNGNDCLSTPCLTIGYALTQAAASGDTISIGAGTFVENVVVDKSVVLAGAGEAETVLRPAISGPICTPPAAASICTGGSYVVLVEADDVEIHDLTIDGDNPDLTSGVVSDGADLDARNGIITNHTAGAFDDLHVHDVTVRNVYLRGIYASSGGTFTLTGNTVENVQADPSSICMFNFGGSGTMSLNNVSGCNDGISSNWSTGVQFLDNTITDSFSAVHSDNAQGPTPDLIEGNQATSMAEDSYGFWVFNPAVPPTVRDNTAIGITVGLGAFGGVGVVTVPFEGNVVDCEDRANSIGAWVSTTLFQFGSEDTGALLDGNRIEDCGIGIDIQAEAGFTANVDATGNTVVGSATAGVVLEDAATDGTYGVALDYNRIAGNGVGLTNATGQAVAASLNWWGCNAGPGGSGTLGACDTVSGTTTFTPWLVLATPLVNPESFAVTGGSATVTVDLAHDSTAAPADPGVPDGTPVAFTTSLAGGILTPPTDSTVDGEASSLLTASSGGIGTVCAAVDNEQTCSGSVTVGGYNTVAPCRILDTREPGQGPSLSSDVSRDVAVTGVCGVPAGARIVGLNVTVVHPTGPGHLTLFPADSSLPLASTINFRAGTTRANNAVLRVEPGTGEIRVHPFVLGGGTADLVIDVFGYVD